jgi:hypothetical protein
MGKALPMKSWYDRPSGLLKAWLTLIVAELVRTGSVNAYCELSSSGRLLKTQFGLYTGLDMSTPGRLERFFGRS